MNTPQIAVVVPSLAGDAQLVLASLERQTLRAAELEVVPGIRPSGRARNIGARRTTAEILVFVDDDAELATPETLAKLVAPLSADATIGVTGASKVIPKDASAFQRAVARQVARIEHPVIESLRETSPLDRHGYTDVTTTCCAMPRRVFDEAGGFHEGLERGVDSEFFRRLARVGYRLVLVPESIAYHPPPRTLRALVRKHFFYGVGFAQEVQLDPERGARRRLSTPVHALAYLLIRTVGLVPHVFVPYTEADPCWRPGFKPLRALASYSAALGHVYGRYRRRLPQV